MQLSVESVECTVKISNKCIMLFRVECIMSHDG